MLRTQVTSGSDTFMLPGYDAVVRFVLVFFEVERGIGTGLEATEYLPQIRGACVSG
jgi:hypothetical protein